MCVTRVWVPIVSFNTLLMIIIVRKLINLAFHCGVLLVRLTLRYVPNAQNAAAVAKTIHNHQHSISLYAVRINHGLYLNNTLHNEHDQWLVIIFVTYIIHIHMYWNCQSTWYDDHERKLLEQDNRILSQDLSLSYFVFSVRSNFQWKC